MLRRARLQALRVLMTVGLEVAARRRARASGQRSGGVWLAMAATALRLRSVAPVRCRMLPRMRRVSSPEGIVARSQASAA